MNWFLTELHADLNHASVRPLRLDLYHEMNRKKKISNQETIFDINFYLWMTLEMKFMTMLRVKMGRSVFLHDAKCAPHENLSTKTKSSPRCSRPMQNRQEIV